MRIAGTTQCVDESFLFSCIFHGRRTNNRCLKLCDKKAPSPQIDPLTAGAFGQAPRALHGRPRRLRAAFKRCRIMLRSNSEKALVAWKSSLPVRVVVRRASSKTM
jgi:hypothetical protein